MKTISVKKWTCMGLLALALVAPNWAGAAQATFGRIVVFGDSLSDPGNVFALKRVESTPPYNTLDPLLIPEAPYAKGGHHFSNGSTWVEQLARSSGLAGDTRPAFQGSNTGATNYAVGGARAHDDGKNFNLTAQVNAFLGDSGGAAPSDALYVVEFGGNDIHDALGVLPDVNQATTIISEALYTIGNNIGALYGAGARKFLVWSAPDLGLTPAILTLNSVSPGAKQAAESLSQQFNLGLDVVLGSLTGLPGIEIVRLDVNQILNELVSNPGAFDLKVVDAACVTPNIPPFECQTPDEYLFWDGIHPTKAVHDIIAQEAALVLTH